MTFFLCAHHFLPGSGWLLSTDYCRIEYANYTAYNHCLQLIQSVYQIFIIFILFSPFENTYILAKNALILKMNFKTFMLHLFSKSISKDENTKTCEFKGLSGSFTIKSIEFYRVYFKRILSTFYLIDISDPAVLCSVYSFYKTTIFLPNKSFSEPIKKLQWS